MRDRRHGRRHREPAVPRGDPPARQRARARARAVRPSDAGAVDPVGRRAQDQADAAFGQGAARPRHPARHPALPLRPRRSRSARAARSRCSAICGQSAVIPALDVDTIYEVPIAYHERGLRPRGLPAFRPRRAGSPTSTRWQRHRAAHPQARGRGARSPSSASTPHLLDSYKSLAEALTHGGIANNVRVKLDWIDSEIFETRATRSSTLEDVHGILVPGGFGERGAEGKIAGGALRPRAQGALFRHLLRHADGGDRGGAASRRHRAARARPSSARAPSRWSA